MITNRFFPSALSSLSHFNSYAFTFGLFFFEKKKRVPKYIRKHYNISVQTRILVVVKNVGKSPYELDLIKNVLAVEEWREKKNDSDVKATRRILFFNVLFSHCACFYFINFIRCTIRIRTAVISLKFSSLLWECRKNFIIYYKYVYDFYIINVCKSN